MEITLEKLIAMKASGDKIVCLTCYDSSFTTLMEDAGVEILLVGDSLGMVLQGHDTTLPVTLTDMVYHTRNVASKKTHALLITDMPYKTYQTPEQALQNAKTLVDEAGAQLVKIEGGNDVHIEIVKTLVKNNINVCGHLGLLPQSIKELGGYKVQGRNSKDADQICQQAQALQNAGASLLVLECVPESLGTRISQQLDIPVIGIGAGAGCDGQVLVLYDMLGITSGRQPKFSRNFLEDSQNIKAAIRLYVSEVKSGDYPGPEHTYS